MDISYEGIGAWCATFTCETVREGEVVKAAEGGVAACAAGEGFYGVVAALARDKKACSVQLGGLVKIGYSGEAPALGFAKLSADGEGGVKSDSTGGREYAVLAVDETAKSIVVKL